MIKKKLITTLICVSTLSTILCSCSPSDIYTHTGHTSKNIKKYDSYISSADNYINAGDYITAENELLNAITLLNDKSEAYERLLEIYISQFETTKIHELIIKTDALVEFPSERLVELTDQERDKCWYAVKYMFSDENGNMSSGQIEYDTSGRVVNSPVSFSYDDNYGFPITGVTFSFTYPDDGTIIQECRKTSDNTIVGNILHFCLNDNGNISWMQLLNSDYSVVAGSDQTFEDSDNIYSVNSDAIYYLNDNHDICRVIKKIDGLTSTVAKINSTYDSFGNRLNSLCTDNHGQNKYLAYTYVYCKAVDLEDDISQFPTSSPDKPL